MPTFLPLADRVLISHGEGRLCLAPGKYALYGSYTAPIVLQGSFELYHTL